MDAPAPKSKDILPFGLTEKLLTKLCIVYFRIIVTP